MVASRHTSEQRSAPGSKRPREIDAEHLAHDASTLSRSPGRSALPQGRGAAGATEHELASKRSRTEETRTVTAPVSIRGMESEVADEMVRLVFASCRERGLEGLGLKRSLDILLEIGVKASLISDGAGIDAVFVACKEVWAVLVLQGQAQVACGLHGPLLVESAYASWHGARTIAVSSKLELDRVTSMEREDSAQSEAARHEALSSASGGGIVSAACDVVAAAVAYDTAPQREHRDAGYAASKRGASDADSTAADDVGATSGSDDPRVSCPTLDVLRRRLTMSEPRDSSYLPNP